MVKQQEWLDVGLVVLAENGMTGLRVETLSRRLALTKGSFYHHFVDLGDFRRALLAHYEQTCTREHLDANAALDATPALARLEQLADTVLQLETVHSGLELALRAWATQDDDARQTMTRVDASRIGYVEGLLADVVGDASVAHDMARSLYYVHVGAQHAHPPARPEDVRRLYRAFLDQIATSTGPGHRSGCSSGSRPSPGTGSATS